MDSTNAASKQITPLLARIVKEDGTPTINTDLVSAKDLLVAVLSDRPKSRHSNRICVRSVMDDNEAYECVWVKKGSIPQVLAALRPDTDLL